MHPAVFDGHNDTLLNLRLPERGKDRSFFEHSLTGHIDLPRAREGNFSGGFFACFVPNSKDSGWDEESALRIEGSDYKVAGAPPVDPVYAKRVAGELATDLFRSGAGV